MTVEEQLKKWVDGNPVHNHERGECCPDFSCCTGKLASLHVRERFTKAYRDNDEDTIMQMLGMFLGEALQDCNKKVHIAGDVPTSIH